MSKRLRDSTLDQYFNIKKPKVEEESDSEDEGNYIPDFGDSDSEEERDDYPVGWWSVIIRNVQVNPHFLGRNFLTEQRGAGAIDH